MYFTLNDSSPADACASAGELYAVIRPRALRDPYRGGSIESRGLHGYAYADGSRASWRDGGCSAGKYACSYFVSLIFAVRALTGIGTVRFLVHGGTATIRSRRCTHNSTTLEEWRA